MAHLIMHGEAPLASGDELTPSLEYTLDEPNPLHDDLAERDQPTPSSDEKTWYSSREPHSQRR